MSIFVVSFNLSVNDYVKGLFFKTLLKNMNSFHTFGCMYLIHCNIITPWRPDSSLNLDFRNYILHVFFTCPCVVIVPSDEEYKSRRRLLGNFPCTPVFSQECWRHSDSSFFFSRYAYCFFADLISQ